MKLLVVTQIVDQQDSNLGFFHTWLKQLALRVDALTIICLEQGSYNLPANVQVRSLGKENGRSRWQYTVAFYRHIFSLRHEYDHVFVHMNPEYVILGGIFWRMWRKKVLLWYVHKAVNLRLRFAALLTTKIFTASKESFRLPSKKVEVVGHGIDVSEFRVQSSEFRVSSPILKLLYVGRISPIKDLETVILAFHELIQRHEEREIWLDIVGDTITSQDEEYRQTLLDLAAKLRVSHRVQFLGGVPYAKMSEIYAAHHALVHTSRTGSIDKVVLEALASGLPVLTSSAAYDRLGDLVWHFPPNKAKELAAMIEISLFSQAPKTSNAGRTYVDGQHNLETVIDKIVSYFQI